MSWCRNRNIEITLVEKQIKKKFKNKINVSAVKHFFKMFHNLEKVKQL